MLIPTPFAAATARHEELARRVEASALLTGRFRLRSGGTSDRYFDKYRFEADPLVLRQIAEAMAPLVPPGIDAIAGLELGGVPLATMLSQATGLPTLFVRKQPKTYGTCRYAEGGDVAQRRLLLVEDVITSGGQVIESAHALRRDGALIDHVVCVIDRCAGGTDTLRRDGLQFAPLFTVKQS